MFGRFLTIVVGVPIHVNLVELIKMKLLIGRLRKRRVLCVRLLQDRVLNNHLSRITTLEEEFEFILSVWLNFVMIYEGFQVFDHLFVLAVVENPLNAMVEGLLARAVILSDVVVQILHQSVDHAGIGLTGAIHQKHRRLNQHDHMRLALIIRNPVIKQSLEHMGLMDKMCLLLDQVSD